MLTLKDKDIINTLKQLTTNVIKAMERGDYINAVIHSDNLERYALKIRNYNASINRAISEAKNKAEGL